MEFEPVLSKFAAWELEKAAAEQLLSETPISMNPRRESFARLPDWADVPCSEALRIL